MSKIVFLILLSPILVVFGLVLLAGFIDLWLFCIRELIALITGRDYD